MHRAVARRGTFVAAAQPQQQRPASPCAGRAVLQPSCMHARALHAARRANTDLISPPTQKTPTSAPEAPATSDAPTNGSAATPSPLVSPPNNGSTARWQIMGLDATPELLAIFLVYFVQGILGLSRLAVSYYFKDDLGMDPAELAIYQGFTAVPWLIKPIYGFASDTFPIFGYRRRSYLVLCGVLGSLAWTSMFLLHPGAPLATLFLVAGSAGTACSDVVVDSIVVEASRGRPASVAGSYQSLSWGSSAIGGIVSAYFSGSLIERYGVSFVFGVTAVFPLLVVGSALLINEARVSHPALAAAKKDAGGVEDGEGGGLVARSPMQSDVAAQGRRLWEAIRQPNIFYPALFVFLWQATPSADSAMFYFYTEKLHFGPEFLGRVRLVGSFSTLAGVYIFNTYLKRVKLRTIFRWGAVIGTLLSLTQVILVTGLNQTFGISDEYFCLADEIVLTVLGRISFMPVLVLAARVCPEGVEATLFATLMSVCNSGAVTGSFVGSLATKGLGVTSTNFDNLALLVSLCALGTLLPLPLVRLVPDLDADEDGADGGDE